MGSSVSLGLLEDIYPLQGDSADRVGLEKDLLELEANGFLKKDPSTPGRWNFASGEHQGRITIMILTKQ